jgi:hypothetical protein
MNSRWIVVFVLMIALVSPSRDAADSDSLPSVGEAIEIDPELIICDIQSERSAYREGDFPVLWVRIFNASNETIYLPGSLDDSERKKRYPHVFFEITGPPGGVQERQLVGCGHINALRASDFVEIEPGQFLNPYSRIDGGRFFQSLKLGMTRLSKPGEYQVTFHYSTSNPDIAAWLGDMSSPSEEVIGIVPRVPLVDISCATTLQVRQE